FDDLGLANHASAVLKGFGEKFFIVLLDGFDELGLQSWTEDPEKIKAMRYESLEGVRDLINRAGGSIFIAGREHYFNNNEEMFSSLGLTQKKPVAISCKEEFTEAEMGEYMGSFSEDFDIPTWLPRRPLI